MLAYRRGPQPPDCGGVPGIVCTKWTKPTVKFWPDSLCATEGCSRQYVEHDITPEDVSNVSGNTPSTSAPITSITPPSTSFPIPTSSLSQSGGQSLPIPWQAPLPNQSAIQAQQYNNMAMSTNDRWVKAATHHRVTTSAFSSPVTTATMLVNHPCNNSVTRLQASQNRNGHAASYAAQSQCGVERPLKATMGIAGLGVSSPDGTWTYSYQILLLPHFLGTNMDLKDREAFGTACKHPAFQIGTSSLRHILPALQKWGLLFTENINARFNNCVDNLLCQVISTHCQEKGFITLSGPVPSQLGLFDNPRFTILKPKQLGNNQTGLFLEEAHQRYDWTMANFNVIASNKFLLHPYQRIVNVVIGFTSGLNGPLVQGGPVHDCFTYWVHPEASNTTSPEMTGELLAEYCALQCAACRVEASADTNVAMEEETAQDLRRSPRLVSRALPSSSSSASPDTLLSDTSISSLSSIPQAPALASSASSTPDTEALHPTPSPPTLASRSIPLVLLNPVVLTPMPAPAAKQPMQIPPIQPFPPSQLLRHAEAKYNGQLTFKD
ncbi:hypothetical protein V5O48_017043 [Marasmius crinis-equi]|uniref:Uncharacterized protein n=1 Tax=Marasmius crinis-equi TaxID=585013 RepID=A0ABR3EQ28_9AGAR